MNAKRWQVKSNGLNYIIFDPEDDFRTVAECARKEDAEMICALKENISWRTGALADYQQTIGELRAANYDLRHRHRTLHEVPIKLSTEDQCALQSLAFAARQLCDWTRNNEYPQNMTPEFMELTTIINNLDTEVRRIFRS